MEKKKEVIFLDFDGVQFNTLPVLVAYLNNRYNLNIEYENCTENTNWFSLVKENPTWNKLSLQEFWYNFGVEYRDNITAYNFCEPIKNFCYVVKELSRKYSIFTVTARQDSSRIVLEYLHNKYIPCVFSGTHFVWQSKDSSLVEISKIEFIKRFGTKSFIFIDDSPREILLAQDTVRSILFNPIKVSDNIKEHIGTWTLLGDMLL